MAAPSWSAGFGVSADLSATSDWTSWADADGIASISAGVFPSTGTCVFDSPGEISQEDWREYLGKREYQRAFVDFFEDQLVQLGYDWHALLEEYAFKGPEPLINGMVLGGRMSSRLRVE